MAGERMGRRGFLLGSAGVLASTALPEAVAWGRTGAQPMPGSNPHRHHHPSVALAEPKPVPGGTQVPDGPLLHAFLPGPEGQKLPHSGLEMQGLNVEPSTVTDFEGLSALAILAGTAVGSDGEPYDLELDIRALEGDYVAVDGSRRWGSFGFI